ncbi:dsDNA nuclease domain-containing protein [Acinetobacter sp. MB5]|uniref:dsDNA nuclease domain-containing protein n=1 Tax=Acinetobacter sp. MB5 TaxID=2069438 RepID=UPI000DCFE34F|nr:dsDNA nuclease domain-containing protein [Acinetobacter sp. MB5]
MQNPNILNDEERENKGLDTSLRFEYQIDWAIYHALDKLNKKQEFVAFVEFHEDVLFANSCTYSPTTKFELFQIKTTYKSYTPRSITSTGSTNSTLGKMILGVKDKSFENQVDKLCLLCLEDINFSNKIKDIDKDYKFSELHENDKKVISTAISNELNFTINAQYEDMIVFRKTGLKLDDSDSQIKHKIYDFIENHYGDVGSRPREIYRLLKDDLRPKSKHKNRYEYWEDCVKHRGLESKKISEDILNKTDQDIDQKLEKLITVNSQNLKKTESQIQRILNKIRAYYLFKMCIKPAALQTELDTFLENIRPQIPLDIDEENTYKMAVDFLDQKVNEMIFLKEYNRLQAVAIYEVFRMILDDEQF